ncbi:aromatic acid exporter family protein [Paenibacillus arenilitoris]|uniref:Aromatic acid exporter family protein n=1 Tax=Paenibacillus arenilitoris TaxID=2772299 RepID=A0A927CKR5_9BACL|nr:aromatic acid exporter family protein [Paenibacillus arenilitoris]MBD2869849.1 aromatic acid exporter family protein [Paenibacillus arenilitoris]
MGIRIVKTALAAIAAIYTAVYLGLEPPLGAGILAILGVEVTRMKGLKSAFVRFVASVLGLFFASFIFTVFGFHIWAVAIFILLTFPVLSRFQLKDGIVTSSVIVFHLFDRAEVTTDVIANEILLLIAGLGWATLVNIAYMPKDERRLSSYRSQLEQSFGVIFKEMSLTLRNPEHVWNGGELLEAIQAVEEGAQQSARNRENRLWGGETYWPTYFEMRRQQLDSIQQMLVSLACVFEEVPQAAMIAELFERLSGDVKSDVYEGSVEVSLNRLSESFRTMELPKSRDEFEVRAALRMLLHELERYLAIAKRLKKRKVLTSELRP